MSFSEIIWIVLCSNSLIIHIKSNPENETWGGKAIIETKRQGYIEIEII